MKNNTDIVIFGGLGDLSIRKLLPALYRSEVDEQLADNTRIFLISRRTVSDAECVEKVKDALNEFMRPGEFDGDHWNKYSARIQHVYIELATADESWDVLRETLLQTGNQCRVLYFAIPPSIYGQTCATPKDPTPPEAPLINTLSPGLIEQSFIPIIAAWPDIGTVAACSKETVSGFLTKCLAFTIVYSAKPPPKDFRISATTESPI